jgi:hypothetical protein
MGFKYSTFFSYRHTKHREGMETQRKVMESLEFELSVVSDLPVYHDDSRLKAGDAFNIELATALCQSVTMVSLWWPTYFSLQNTYCTREYKAMEALEERRLNLLDPATRSKKLIIVVALRPPLRMPAEIRNNRQFIDLSKETLDPNMEKRQSYRVKIRNIAESIAERQHMLDSLDRLDDECGDYRLPESREIEPWIRQISQVPTPWVFPLTG